MEQLKFKTNIKCGGCIAAVTPILNNLTEITKWEVDTVNPDKILTVESNGNLNQDDIVKSLEKAGYKAERV